MDEALPMQPEGWMILTRRLTLFFAGLAVANEAIWRLMSDGRLGELQDLRADGSACSCSS